MENEEAPLCACGCQGKVNWNKQKKCWNRFLNYHGRGWKASEEKLEKMRKRNLGKKLSIETKEKISKSLKGRIVSEETREKLSKSHLGKIFSEETKRKISLSKIGNKTSEETKRKISLSLSGENHWNFGKTHSEETLKKMSIGRSGYPSWQKGLTAKEDNRILSGRNHGMWKGGINPLRKQIRSSVQYYHWRDSVFERDDFTCQECNKRGGDLNAHHIYQFNNILIDHNIHNLEDALQCQELWGLNNGITLCKKCHKKEHKQRTNKILSSQIIKQNEGEVNV